MVFKSKPHTLPKFCHFALHILHRKLHEACFRSVAIVFLWILLIWLNLCLINTISLQNSKIFSYHSDPEHIKAGVTVNSFTSAQHAIITTVHSTDPNHPVHLLSKLPPLWDTMTWRSNKLQCTWVGKQTRHVVLHTVGARSWQCEQRGK